MFCASIVYQAHENGSFDFDYFAGRHAPLFAGFLGKNCVRYEVHRGLDTPGAPPAPFLGAAYFWVTSAEEFGATLVQHGQQLYADIPEFSDQQPVRGWAEVL